MTMINRQWLLRNRPEGLPQAEDLMPHETEARLPDTDEVLVRNIYLSLDPTNRLWMSSRDQYQSPVGLGEVMRGSTIAMVETSHSSRFKPGDIVRVRGGGWQQYATVPASVPTPITAVAGIPLSAHLSVLGATGLTAYVGMVDVGQVSAGDTVVVSAAAGAVGSVAGQIARIAGATVVGIAGGPDKCRWLTQDLGFDAAIDYRREDVGARLDLLLPQGIDLDFENVGGDVMEAVYARLNIHGRMALCGMISAYNQEGPLSGPADFGGILMRRLTVRGFTVTDHFERGPDIWRRLATWIATENLQWKDHIIPGLENAPSALSLLFSGGNDGKLMIEISPPPA